MARSAVFCTHIAVSHKFRSKCEGYRKNVGCCCLTAHFKRSTVSTEALRAKQVALGGVGASAESGVEEQCKILEVTTDCSTRWNSTLDMLDRLVKLRWAIGAVLSDPTFTEDGHWSLALIPILTPLKRITTLSSGQNYPSLSSVFPHLFIIIRNIEVEVAEEPAAAKECRQIIVRELKRRYYADGYATSNAAKAAVLDPRYKLMKFFEEGQRKESYEAIRSEINGMLLQPVPATSDSSSTNPPPAKKCKLDAFDDELADLCSSAAADNNGFIHELDVYLSETPLTLNSDILQYWRDNCARLPKMASLARKYLCIPATSVPSESTFSTAGFVINVPPSPQRQQICSYS